MKQKQFNSIARFLLILILVWNLLITTYLIVQHNQRVEDKINQAVCVEELIPIEDIEE